MIETLSLPSTSTWLVDNGLLAVSANSYFSADCLVEKSQLFFLPDMHFKDCVKLAQFNEKRNCLLYATRSHTLLGLDNTLLISSNLKTWKKVLTLENSENILWHMAETKDGVLFAQEYGRVSTGIYRSTDGGYSWKRVVTSKRIDDKSRHFHSVAYDPYRDMLVVTLGDRNSVKIAFSADLGETWKPVYHGAYQCFPIAVLKDNLVFGMDSAISNGIVLWDPRTDSFREIHIIHKGKADSIGTMQSSDLKILENGVSLMSTGGGSLLFTENFVDWHIAVLGRKQKFEAHTISNERNGAVAVSMIDSTLIIDSKTLAGKREPAEVKEYRAFFPKVRGFGYILKRIPLKRSRSQKQGSNSSQQSGERR